MPNRLELPDDLNALVEKRSGEDRREQPDTPDEELSVAEQEKRRNERRQSETRNDELPALDLNREE